MDLNVFIKYLNKYKAVLSKQQYRTIRGQAIAGDIVGAKKGLQALIERSTRNEHTKNENFRTYPC